ncbi:hypothetical protein XENOCAPTIV_029341, partial [Xenoophorus captivus]
CEATAKGRPKLREHLRSHTQEKVVACPGCGGMYANNTKFFDHMIRQNAMEAATVQSEVVLINKFQSFVLFAFCSCKNLIDLRKHLDTHSSDPAFRCDVPGCGFTSRTSGTMKIHHQKEHELIRYESVELTEQLMREKQKRSVEDDDDDSGHAEDQELEEDPVAAAAAASQVQVQLRGVLLEEQRTEESTIRSEEPGQVEDMLYVLTGGEDSVILQLQGAAQQQGVQVD